MDNKEEPIMDTQEHISQETKKQQHQQTLSSIEQITLECLMNKEQYNKYLGNKINKMIENNKHDKRFYRKRILQLAKDMLINTPEDTLPSDVIFAFENFVKMCIPYFKIVDKTDIIQNEYDTVDLLNIVSNTDSEGTDTYNVELSNKLMMRSIKMEKNTLDKFVKFKTLTKEPMIIPVQKEINLKDPSLRNKGIVKKKNIDNKYEINPQNIQNAESQTQS
jgi:hypothetical protein